MPDADRYWAYFNDARARGAHLVALRRGFGPDAGRLDVETFLFAFRMFIESFCVMARYGVLAHDALSKGRVKAFRPRDILDDLRHLQGARFVGLATFATTADSHAADIGLRIDYAATVRLDVARLGAVHGRLGAFAHVTSALPGEDQARALMAECFGIFGDLAPLLRRHILAVTSAADGGPDLGGLTLLLGQDDAGRDWFIERRGPGLITIRLRPVLD